ncbi:MAG: hypothetical protein KZQ93_04375 [Candidatus Thiodiazotropha sp. (ex Monitilora ramsayi)]|nr:hypothetical protein [Candidatus Thiodiazotropha sp. (ex Monitilora ramsayi)]
MSPIIEAMEASSKIKELLLYLPGVLALLLFVEYGIGDYWVIGVVADPEEIERYNFGAEAMIAHGGDKYRSSSAYATSSLVTGLLASIGLAVSLTLLLRSRIKPLLKAYSCTGVTLVAIMFLGHAW